MKRQTKRLLSMIAAMIVVLTTILAPASVAAAEKVDTSKSGSASLVLELPAASDSVKLYQIAEYDSDSKIVMKKEAQDLKVTIDGKESESSLSQKAKTLAGKFKTVTATGKTDAKLSVKFDKLKLGYYLVVVDKCGSDSKKYEVAPVIIGVPAAQKSSWKYDVTVKLKGQEVKATPVPATTTPKAPTSPAKDETVGADDSTPTDSGITAPSPTPTEEATPTPTEEATPTPTEEATPTPTEEATPTPTEEATPTPTEEATPTPTEEATPTPTKEATPTPTKEATPSVTGEPTESVTPSVTGEPTDTETPTPSITGETTETETPTPGTDSDDSNPDFPPDESSIPDLTVTPDPNLWQMSVTKYWIDKNNLPLSDKDETIPDSLSIQIWKKASAEAKWQKIELVDLTAENGWTYSWTAPDDDATWTVTEDVVPIGFTQMTIKQSKNTKAKTLAFKVTNMSNADVTPAPIQLSVVKYWKDKNENGLDDKDINVKSLPIQIYRREKDAQAWKLYKTAELTAETAWEYHWGAPDDGASWTVTERDVPEGYVLQTPIRLAHNAANTKLEFRMTNVVNDGSITLVPTPTNIPITTPTSTPTNTVTPKTPTPTPEIVTYNVVKKWQSESGAQLSASQTGVSSLTVDIYRKSPGATSFTKVETVELLPYDNWAYSWRAADDGSTWTVTEPRIPSGYVKVGITLVKNDTAHTRVFTITNKKTSPGSSVVETSTVTPSPTPEAIGTPTARPVTKMPTATPKPPTPTPTPTTIRYTIVKKWLTSEGAVLDSSYTGVSSLTIDIYRKQSDETSSIKVGSVELYPSNDWTYSWTTPDDGSTWTVTEPNVPEGYTNVGIVSKSEHAYSRVFTITNKKSSGSPTEPTPTETPTPTLTETPTPTPGTESDDSNPDFPPDESSIPDLTVTPDPNLWQMSVTKYWIDKNNLPLSDKDETIPDSLSIQIWKKASAEAKWQKMELVDLTAENGWTYSWTAPDDDATWTVTEDVVPIGFTQMTIKQSKNAKAKTLAFKVTNMSNADVTPAPIQLSVVKYWKDKNENDLDDKDINVKSLPIQIYRREKDAQAWKLYKTAELTAETAWEYHWGAADDGATWTVTEREVPEGYTLQTPIKLAHNKDNTRLEFRVTNISASGDVPPTTPPTGTPLTDTPTTPPNTITYSVVKEWQTSTGEFLSASQTGVSSLAVDIYQKKPGAKGYAKVKTVELNSSNSWLYSWTAQDDGSSWTVTEPSEPAGYRKVGITQQKNTNARTCRFTITNRKKAQTPTPTPATISFSVVKKWQSASGAQLSSSQTGVSSLTVDIYRKYPGATSYTKVDSIELLPSNNWTHSWTAKDDGSTWTVTEPHVPSGYTKVGITQSKNDTARTRLFTITNKKSSSGSNSDTNSNTRKVTATATPKVTGSTRNTPNTGDNQNIWIPIMTMLSASVVLVVLAKKRAR